MGKESRRGSSRRSKHHSKPSGSDDDDLSSSRGRHRSSSKKKKSASSPRDDDSGSATPSPRASEAIRKAAMKSHLRKRNSQEDDPPLSSSRADRRERRKSRRGSKLALNSSVASEGKSVDSVDASELDARQRRREQRRNKRTPKHDHDRTGGFFTNSSPPLSGSTNSRLSSSGAASETTEVEVIAWQHRINQKSGDEDSDLSGEEDLELDVLNADEGSSRAGRQHPVPKSSALGGSWGSRQHVPPDSDSTAGIKDDEDSLQRSPSFRERRQLSPVNVRRRAEEKLKKKRSMRGGTPKRDESADEPPHTRKERRRSGRRGSSTAKKPVEESSESSSEDDEAEVTGRRRRTGGRRERAKQLKIEKPRNNKSSSGSRRSPSASPERDGSPDNRKSKDKRSKGRRGRGRHKNKHSSSDEDSDRHSNSPSRRSQDSPSKTLHRTSHELDLRSKEGGTPQGHKKLSRESPVNADVRAKLKDQLEEDGLKRGRKSRGKGHGGEGKDGHESDSGSSSAGDLSENKTDDDDDGPASAVDFTAKGRSPNDKMEDPEVTPGDKGRAVFKGALEATSPSKSGSGGGGGGGPADPVQEYSLAANANWVQRQAFLTSPVPVGAGIQQCSVVRSKKKDTFVLWLETTKAGKGKQVEFLMAGKQRHGAKATLNYVLSMDETDHSRQGKGCIGKLRANMRTTEYTLFDEGLNPTLAGNRRKAASPGNSTQLREELCLIQFIKGSMGFARGPREITAHIPIVNKKTLETLRCRPIREEDGLRSWITAEDGPAAKTFRLINKPPVWNEQVRKYILNFNGRVEVASVKNFQLVLQQDQENLVLQCGRSHDSEDGSSTFILDFGWPLSPVQAFSIGLAGMTA